MKKILYCLLSVAKDNRHFKLRPSSEDHSRTLFYHCAYRSVNEFRPDAPYFCKAAARSRQPLHYISIDTDHP